MRWWVWTRDHWYIPLPVYIVIGIVFAFLSGNAPVGSILNVVAFILVILLWPFVAFASALTLFSVHIPNLPDLNRYF